MTKPEQLFAGVYAPCFESQQHTSLQALDCAIPNSAQKHLTCAIAQQGVELIIAVIRYAQLWMLPRIIASRHCVQSFREV
jgi:organic hydroperoxide reductase OsmC/OhrA